MVYVFLADGFEEIEALTVVDILRRAQIETETVAISDCTSCRYITGAHNITVKTDITADETDYQNADAVVLPGGLPGTTNLKNSDTVTKALDFAYNNHKIIAAICAAPSIFADLGYLNNKKATANPDFMDKLDNAIKCEDRVVCHGNIVTSRAAGTAAEFALNLVELLKDKNTADKLKAGMLY